MKKRRIAIPLILAGLTLSSISLALVSGFSNAHEVKAASPTVTTTTPSTVSDLPTTIDLNDTSESDIRNYYASAAGLSGTNLLIQLKTILITNPLDTTKPAQYYSYSNDRQIYKISDRQWSLYDVNGYDGSNSVSGYSSANNQITSYDYSDDPYLHFYYRDDNETNPHKFSAKQTKVNSSSSHSMLCQEHLWSKSHGFSESGGVPNAGSDLHHLVAADYAVNSWAHSNYSYGVVSESVENNSFYNNACNWGPNESLSGKNAIINNKLGTAANFSEYDEGSATVFEPQDSDKGDIARALLFMVARYNWFGATDKSCVAEPYLELVNKVINGSENSSSGHGAVPYGCLNDLLIWHFNDLPDEYEIHRNNIIYNNFQHTRNPFIDFPEWVSYIWGRPQSNPTSSSSKYNPTGTANPSSDTINDLNSGSTVAVTGVSLNKASATIENGNTLQLTATVSPSNATNKAVTWTSNNTSVATVSSNGLVTAKGAGNAKITVKTADGNFTAQCNVSVTSSGVSVTGVSLNTNSLSLEEEESSALVATVLPANADDKSVTWTSSNTTVATVSSTGVVSALKAGSTTITVRTTDGGFTASCTVTVTAPVVQTNFTFTIDLSYFTTATYDNNNGSKQSTAVLIDGDGSQKVTWSSYQIKKPSSSATEMQWQKATSYILIEIPYSKVLTCNIVSSAGNFVTSEDESTGYFKIAEGGTATGAVTSIEIVYSADLVAVTGVTLNRNTLELDSGSSALLTATVLPTNASNNGVIWSSSNTSVATVNDGTVTGNIPGSAVITVTTTEGNFTATCSVTVVSVPIAVNKVATLAPDGINPGDKVIIAAQTSADAATAYVMKNQLIENSTYSYVSTSVSVSNHAIAYTSAATVWTVGGEAGALTFFDGANYLYAYTSPNTSYAGSYYRNIGLSTDPVGNSLVYTWNVRSNSNNYSSDMVAQVPVDNKNYNVYMEWYSDHFCGYSKVNSDCLVCFYKIYSADDFANDFVSRITCDSTGSTAPVMTNTWSDISNLYDSIWSTSEQDLLKYATFTVSGSGSSTVVTPTGSTTQIVAEAMSKYDIIVGKYGTSTYADFIHRNPAQIGNTFINLRTENSTNHIIVISVTVISMLAITGFVIIRKRKLTK